VLGNDSPVPLHEQLSALLRRRIATAKLTGRVPSIVSLAQEHDVSHRTAARAQTTLRDEADHQLAWKSRPCPLNTY
jgi:DNA-binding transcriptional regulator YhcF (GntR family)